jgi:3-oxoacyl-[acyl-carrier-protein] synthase II
MSSERRVVITGFNAVTPIGIGHEAIWESLSLRRSGIDRLQAFNLPEGAPVAAGEVRDFEPKAYVAQRKSLRIMARDIQLAVGAAKLALDHSGAEKKVDPARIGVNCGAGLIATELEDLGVPVHSSIDGRGKFDIHKWGLEGMEQLYPLWMLKYLPNMPACHISIQHDAQGPNNSVTAGEASALLAIGEAFRIVARDQADMFLAGGSDTKIHPLSFVRLALLNKLTSGEGEPSAAARPYDAAATGLVPSEAAAFVALEDAGHAARRGARVYAEVLGFGSACDRTSPRRGIASAANKALADAGLKPSDLGFVIGHGAGSPQEDREELLGAKDFLGDAAVPLVGLKGYWGHVAAASGAVEIAAALLGMQHRQLPGGINFAAPGSGAPKLDIVAENRDFPDRPFLVYAVSHGGQTAALALRPHAS